MLRLAFIIAIVLFSLNLASAQDHQKARVYFHSSKQFESYDVVFDAKLKETLFKTTDLTRYVGDQKAKLSSTLRSLLGRRLRFFFVRDYTPGYKRVVRRRDNNVEISITGYESHPPKFASALVGQRLFVFGGDSEVDDVTVFNALVRDLKLDVTTPDHATAIVELFEYLHGFPPLAERPNVISKFDDIPEIFRRGAQLSLEKRSSIRSPEAISSEGVFRVKYFTWRSLPNSVIQWLIQVGRDGQISISSSTDSLV